MKSTKRDRDLHIAELIASSVKSLGGRTFFVGGYVRDKLLGIENKDIDIEVHGITEEQLKQVLSTIGYIDERKVGGSFGIYNLKGYDIDIAMPRSERPVEGGGHKDFEVVVDPFIGYEKAARRRDFTINAMMEDALTGEVLDYFGGVYDLERKVICHVDDNTFQDDPLRVFRAAQFAARFGFGIAIQTIELARSMDTSTLTRERIAGELDKALLKSDTPGNFFSLLEFMNHLRGWFPEVHALMGVQQDPKHHPEGGAYIHTMRVLNEAAKHRSEVSNPRDFMVAALCHDFGKATTASFSEEKGKWQAIGHDKEGVEIARGFVKRLYNDKRMESHVCNMVENHMRPLNIAKAHLENPEKSNKAAMHMFDESISPRELILLAKCDHDSRMVYPNMETFDKYQEVLDKLLGDYRQMMLTPHVTGIDLIDMGYPQGPKFKEIMDYAHKVRLAGVPKEEALNQIAGMFGKPKNEAAKPTTHDEDEQINLDER